MRPGVPQLPFTTTTAGANAVKVDIHPVTYATPAALDTGASPSTVLSVSASTTLVPSGAWTGWQSVVKRTIDLVGAVLILILISPLLVAIAAAIWIESPGPIIFRQPRMGRNGRVFTFFKFRSMTSDAESRRGELLRHNESTGPLFKIREDPRVTRVGRVLRRFSLDELPQLFNVIRGEMSLVGPRPPLPSEVAHYELWQKDRLLVPGGITGLWQVSGRSDLTFEQMVELDLTYIKTWSLWSDLTILVRTVTCVIFARGAY